MTVLQILFYLLAATAVFSAFMVVISSNPVRGALFLVLTFFSMAGLWLLMHAEFLALTLVLVYVGAVMTLFLFVVMMLSVSRINLKEGFVKYSPIGALFVLAMTAIALIVVGPQHFGLQAFPSPAEVGAQISNTENLGTLLYSHYAYPFEIAAVMLLTAIVAAITLTFRKSERPSKSQKIEAQIAVQPKDRLRMIDMPAESNSKGPTV